MKVKVQLMAEVLGNFQRARACSVRVPPEAGRDETRGGADRSGPGQAPNHRSNLPAAASASTAPPKPTASIGRIYPNGACRIQRVIV